MNPLALAAALLVLGQAGGETEQRPPPAGPSTPSEGIVACVKINDDGDISTAFVVTSSGDASRDEGLLNAIKQLHWDKVPPGNPSRNVWFPMGFALDGAKPPPSPASCAPPPNV